MKEIRKCSPFKNSIHSRTFFAYAGIHQTDATLEKRVDDAFMEALSTTLHLPGDSSRTMVIRLGLELCKGLSLEGKRGDVSILARKLGISHNFAKKILMASLHGTEEALWKRKKRSSAFESTEWAAKFKEFVFKAEHARPVPGDKNI